MRSSHQGESHGGAYRIDLESEVFEKVLDWNESTIDWEGRGGDRGLRGVIKLDDRIYLAASNEIFMFDKDFNLIKSYRNRYLKYCHEICQYKGFLYITSTRFDSVLVFDIDHEKFIKGYCVRARGGLLASIVRKTLGHRPVFFDEFDPESTKGPVMADTVHINNVYVDDRGIFVSGRGLPYLYLIRKGKLTRYGRVPLKTHNARPYAEGIIFNDTEDNRVVIADRKGRIIESFSIPFFDEDKLIMKGLPNDHARQCFGRGLELSKEGLLIGGSSPSTISVYERGISTPMKTITLTLDVRHAIHGIEILEP